MSQKTPRISAAEQRHEWVCFSVRARIDSAGALPALLQLIGAAREYGGVLLIVIRRRLGGRRGEGVKAPWRAHHPPGRPLVGGLAVWSAVRLVLGWPVRQSSSFGRGLCAVSGRVAGLTAFFFFFVTLIGRREG